MADIKKPPRANDLENNDDKIMRGILYNLGTIANILEDILRELKHRL